MDADKDIEMWKKWKKTKDPRDLSQLFSQLENLIQKKVNTFSGAPVPRSALEAEAKKWAFVAFENFNPNMGVKLSTHVTNWLQKLYRYNTTLQNFARIPEHTALKITPFRAAKEELQQKLGRPATQIELADHLHWNIAHVNKIEKSLRQDISATTWQGDENFEQHNPKLEILALGYYSLAPEEQLVYDYTLGEHGKQKMSPGQIAKIMNISPSKVSKLRNAVTIKLQQYLGNG